jgi:hypothetical protein
VHCPQLCYLYIQLQLLFTRQLLPPARGWSSGAKALHQMSHFMQAEAASLREPKHSETVNVIL